MSVWVGVESMGGVTSVAAVSCAGGGGEGDGRLGSGLGGQYRDRLTSPFCVERLIRVSQDT